MAVMTREKRQANRHTHTMSELYKMCAEIKKMKSRFTTLLTVDQLSDTIPLHRDTVRKKVSEILRGKPKSL